MRKRGSSQVKKDSLRRLQERYDKLWSAAIGKIRTGKIESDRVLAGGLIDRRRGLTLIARPSAGVREKVAAFLRELRRLEPDQYYYARADLHLTILSLFNATTAHKRFLAHTEKYLAAVNSALQKAGPMRIEFAGVTASPGAIMIQGFPDTEALNDLRDKLRQQLHIRGLTQGLDVRYRLETAHMTVARFRAPLRDSKHFAAVLACSRRRPFGSMTIKSLSLVTNDWYMTHQTLETLSRYRLLFPHSTLRIPN
ncbi:MAG TPA: 2'-5' RNA ligase family protein [Verrucomicrobiae bacterium]|jgi:2'-5' RNA ligase|nr:2'-5' RNA ligase family protein [Verrucomicrobiae bacterium]